MVARKYILQELPNQIITDIIALVASHSLADLHSAKLSCKYLLIISYDKYVLKNARLDKSHVISWHIDESKCLFQKSFLNLCVKSRNPEALYRKGIVEFFQGRGTDEGLKYLKLAKEAGHLEAY
ncbi:hypothetical protein Leryth_019290 [Lithospermum erythrorhizon]|nr:hypothetical protein Leryth_019290 [Lithospermum erythrorhizon]